MFNEVLGMTNALSESLQSTQVDLGQAVRVVVAVKDTLLDKRSEKAFDKLWDVFLKKWEELEVIDIEEEINKLSRPQRERRLPASLLDSVVDTTIGQRENLQGPSDYRCNMYFLVLDSFIAEMERRFNNESTIMKAIQACMPRSHTFFEWEAIEPFCMLYDIAR